MGVLPQFNALTASASIFPARYRSQPTYEGWQDQAWEFFDTLGELENAVTWKASGVSRVRLLAAEVPPGSDAPVELRSGPAVEFMQRFAGGTGGQSQLLRLASVHLSVPGECWMVGEQTSAGETWRVYSADQLKVSSKNQFKVQESESSWRALDPNSLVVRVWDPHPRQDWRADSETHHAMGALRELDLANKRIMAELTSRLAMNGILLYDKQRLSFPSAGQPSDGDVDPFAAMLVATGSHGIADPMSASAVFPIPIGFDLGDTPMSDIDPEMLLRLIKVTESFDPNLMSERDTAIRRVATNVDMPPEILLGMADTNHWGQWFVEDTAIKMHVSPRMETICHALTEGYLHPALDAIGESRVGENGGQIVVWYDPSEISTKPDKSQNALRVYELGELSGRALRRETGFSNLDAPTGKEWREWILRFLARQRETAPAVLESIGGGSIGDDGERDPGRPEVDGVDETHVPTDETRDAPDPNDHRRRPGGGDSGSVSLDTFSDEDLVAELTRRIENAPKVSQWFEHTAMTEPVRVTPKRRDSSEDVAG